MARLPTPPSMLPEELWRAVSAGDVIGCMQARVCLVFASRHGVSNCTRRGSVTAAWYSERQCNCCLVPMAECVHSVRSFTVEVCLAQSLQT